MKSTYEYLDDLEVKCRRGYAIPPDEGVRLVASLRSALRVAQWIDVGPIMPGMLVTDASMFRERDTDTVVHEPGHVPTNSEEDGS